MLSRNEPPLVLAATCISAIAALFSHMDPAVPLLERGWRPQRVCERIGSYGLLSCHGQRPGTVWRQGAL